MSRSEPLQLTRRQIQQDGDMLVLAEVPASSQRIAAYAKGLSDVEILDILQKVRAVRKELTLAEGLIEQAALEAVGNRKRTTLDGHWTAERHWGKARKEWDHESIAAAVVQRLQVNTETGELAGEEFTQGAFAARDALMAASRPTWRVTALKGMDIDPDDYCRSEPGKGSIEFVSVTEEPTND